MAFAKYLVPAAAAIGRAAAQSCSVEATTTIQNQGDASGLSSCSTFSGSIAIATDARDSIALDGISRIEGGLELRDAPNISSLSADSLERIDEDFVLMDVQTLTTLNFPELTRVSRVQWAGLPELSGLSFTEGLQEVETLDIQNTALNTLDGINLQEVDTLLVVNNPSLNDITMQLGMVSSLVRFQANGREVSVSFPNLQWAYNMTIMNVTNLEIPSLETTNSSLQFYSNFFESVYAPNLTEVGGGLTFVGNSNLDNITMPQLEDVSGGLTIANNTALEEVEGFGSLEHVGGAIDMTGNLTSVKFPALDQVEGALNIESTEDITEDCDNFQSMAGPNDVIQGEFNCEGTVDDPQNKDNSDSSSSSSSSDSSEGAANPVYISGATGLLGVVAAIFGML